MRGVEIQSQARGHVLAFEMGQHLAPLLVLGTLRSEKIAD